MLRDVAFSLAVFRHQLETPGPIAKQRFRLLGGRARSFGILLHNAFDDAVIAELTDAFRSMEAEDGIRVVVLSGAGKSFSAGADLNWMKRMAGFSADENRRDAMGLAALMRTIAHLRKPTVARVQGASTRACWATISTLLISIGR